MGRYNILEKSCSDTADFQVSEKVRFKICDIWNQWNFEKYIWQLFQRSVNTIQMLTDWNFLIDSKSFSQQHFWLKAEGRWSWHGWCLLQEVSFLLILAQNLLKQFKLYGRQYIWPFPLFLPVVIRSHGGYLLSSVQLLIRAQFFLTPWTAAHQASLSITNSWSLLKHMSIVSVMPSNHLILCRPLLLPPSVFPSTRVFSNESLLSIRWPKCWSFSFSISPSNEYSGLIFFRSDWFDLLEVQGTLQSLL